MIAQNVGVRYIGTLASVTQNHTVLVSKVVSNVQVMTSNVSAIPAAKQVPRGSAVAEVMCPLVGGGGFSANS